MPAWCPSNRGWRDLDSILNLERGLVVSLLMMAVAIVGALFGVGLWADESFGDLGPSRVMRI